MIFLKIIYIVIFLMLTSVQYATCESVLSGNLYYAVSNKIINVDLRTNIKKEFYRENDHVVLFNYISRHANGIIIEASDIIKGNSVQVFSLLDKKFKTVTDGSMPTYMQSSNFLFYYRYKNKRNTVSLYRMNLADQKSEMLVVEGTKKQNTVPGPSFYVNIVYPVVAISDDEIIFINIDRELEIYNHQEGSLKKLGLKGFIPFAWRSKANTLSCKNIDDEDFYEVNVQNFSKKKISGLTRVTDNLLYIPDCDCLIYSKYRFFSLAERSDVYAYWLSNSKEEKLWSNDRIMSATWSRKN